MTVLPDPIPPIAARLRERIPSPTPPRARPRATWRRLRAGQRLRLRATIRLLDLGEVGPGSLWIVQSTDSEGVTLAPEGGTGQLRWTLPDWERHWERAPLRQRKEPTT